MHTHTHTQVPTHTLTQFKQNSKFSRTHLVVSFFRFFFRVALRALRYELLPLSLQTEIDATTTACCFKRSIVCRPHRLTQTTRRGGNNSRTLMFWHSALPPQYCLPYWIVVFTSPAPTHSNGDDVLYLFLNCKLFFFDYFFKYVHIYCMYSYLRTYIQYVRMYLCLFTYANALLL